MKNPEDWYIQWLDGDYGDMLSFVKDIQTEAYNQAIDDAANNLCLVLNTYQHGIVKKREGLGQEVSTERELEYIECDRDLILKLKKE